MKHGWAGRALLIGGAMAMTQMSIGAGSGTAVAGKPAAQVEGDAIRPFSSNSWSRSRFFSSGERPACRSTRARFISSSSVR